MYDVESAERFIETVEYDYQSTALQANETVASYSPEEEFLDRYLKIAPEYSFGLGKKELLPDKDLKKFLGY